MAAEGRGAGPFGPAPDRLRLPKSRPLVLSASLLVRAPAGGAEAARGFKYLFFISTASNIEVKHYFAVRPAEFAGGKIISTLSTACFPPSPQ